MDYEFGTPLDQCGSDKLPIPVKKVAFTVPGFVDVVPGQRLSLNDRNGAQCRWNTECSNQAESIQSS